MGRRTDDDEDEGLGYGVDDCMNNLGLDPDSEDDVESYFDSCLKDG